MYRTRSERRASFERKKNEVRDRIKNIFGYEPSEKAVGWLARTPVPCSCNSCGNRRNGNGLEDKTVQERMADEEFHQQLNDYYIEHCLNYLQARDYLRFIGEITYFDYDDDEDHWIRYHIPDEVWEEFVCDENK